MTALSIRRIVAISLASFATVSLLLAQGSHRVTRIVDGDTLVLSELGTVRLIGVDTPETVDPRRPVEEFGRQSSAFLAGLALGKTVRVEYDQTRRDRYGRTLAYLYLSDGTFVNKEIVRLGYGHAYVKYPFKYMEEFQVAGREAQRNRLGLWAAQLAPDAITTVATTPAASTGLLSAAALPAAAAVGASIADETVYVTKSGTKYHVAGCRSLSKSQIPMSLKEAAARYGACSICRPPTLADTGAAAAAPLPAISSPRPTATPASKASSQQCAATTKAGARCKRMASAGSAYCWQHAKAH